MRRSAPSRTSSTLRTALFAGCLGLVAGCGESSDEGSSAAESSFTQADASETNASSSETSTSSESNGSEESESETTGEPPGEEYGPCTSIVDCPEGMLYACLQDVTDGAVCAPGCMDHADCPPPPPGGTTIPVCTLVDERTRCAMLGCQEDDDCPTGMTCHIEGPNWCHWPV